MRCPHGGLRRYFAIEGMKKAPIVWIFLIIYCAAPCAGLLEAGCCLHDADHHNDQAGPHQRVFLPFQIAAHALKHVQGQSGGTVIAGSHCCCIGAYPGEATQGPHSLKRVRTRPPVAPRHDTPLVEGSSDLTPIAAKAHIFPSPEDAGARLALQSIQAVVLLI